MIFDGTLIFLGLALVAYLALKKARPFGGHEQQTERRHPEKPADGEPEPRERRSDDQVGGEA